MRTEKLSAWEMRQGTSRQRKQTWCEILTEDEEGRKREKETQGVTEGKDGKKIKTSYNFRRAGCQ